MNRACTSLDGRSQHAKLGLAVTEFRILGPLDVRENGHAVDVGGGKQRALLAVLLLHAGETVSTDRLADALWGEQPPASATSSMHAYVSRLRRALGRERVVRDSLGYRLVVDPEEVDVTRFERLLASGREQRERGDAAGAAETIRAALALWHGPPLADLQYEPFTRDEIDRLEELRLVALEERMDADLALGRHARLVPELEALVREHALRERARGQLMLALYRAGRQADALETYRQARAMLVGELGLEPGPELQQLERQILSHDPGLATPSTVPAQRSEGTRRRWAVAAALAVGLAAGATALALTRGTGADAVVALPNSVAVIDTSTNQVVADVAVGTHPVGIAARGHDVWVANTNDGTVSRIDSSTRRVTKTISAGGPATDVVVLGPKTIWTGNGSSGMLARLSPDLPEPIETVDLRGGDRLAPNAVYGLASGAGSLWAASGGSVVRLNPRSGKVVKRIAVPKAPVAVAYGLGAVWVATSPDRLVRIEPRTNKPSFATAVGYPAAVAVGRGSVWAGSQSTSPGAVAQLDPATLQLVERYPVPGPTAIAVTASGVWVASRVANAVYRLDPRSGQVVGSVKLRGAPAGLAIVAGRLWVTVDEPTIRGA